MYHKQLSTLLALFFFIMTSSSVSASRQSSYYFKSLEVEDGLSQTMVYAIMQDSHGFMWFGTQNGLNRYDGTSFRIFRREASSRYGMKSSSIFSLAEDGDSVLWVGTDVGVLLYDRFTERFRPLDFRLPDGEMLDGVVRTMLRDAAGNMWVGVSGRGVVCVSAGRKARFYPLSDHLAKGNNIQSICLDKDGNLWIAAHQQGVLKLDTATGRVSAVDVDASGGDSAANEINCLYLLDSETILAGTVGHGVLSLNLRNGRFSPLKGRNNECGSLFVRCITSDGNGNLWFGTQSGLYIYAMGTDRLSHFQHVFNDPYSLSDNAVHSIYQDREGGMWIGTYFGGVNYYSESSACFEKYYPVPGEESLSGKCISELCEDAAGNIWVGTEDGGLNWFAPGTRQFASGFVPAANIHALLFDNNTLWIGSFAEGLFVLDLTTGKVTNHRASSADGALGDDNIYAIYKDFAGDIWIGSMTGLHRYDKDGGKFIAVCETEITSHVNDIVEDFDGVLWFATLGQGLFSYDRKSDRWEHYPTVVDDDVARGKMVVCLLEDSDHRMWIGTGGAGLVCRDKHTRTFCRPLTINDGLPDNVVYEVLEGSDGCVWGSTNKGLFRLNADSGDIKTYTHANGLLGDQFNYKSGFVSSSGKIYFGGVKGFVAFDPDNLASSSPAPAVVFNSFQIDNMEVEPGGTDGILQRSVAETQEISIPYNRSAFSIGFVALSYASQHRIRYSFMLDGWDSDWMDAGSVNMATYSNLDPGSYTFRVKVSDSEHLWDDTEAEMRINVLPPFYRTIWAYAVYALLLVMAVYLLVRGNIRHERKRNAEAIRQLQHDKEKELYDAKINFFTNITHEIRTPLSLIKVPLDEVMRRIDKADGCYEHLSTIQRNTNRLLKLVNELLDFRKMETKGMQLNFVRVDVVELLRDTVKRFVPTAELRNLSVEVVVPDGKLCADMDVEVFTKILSNLLANALKHAMSFIRITLKRQDDDMLRLTVTNDGDRIPPEQAELIFKPFVKLDEHSLGSGIGLPLARTLVETHKGRIFVDPGQEDATFVLLLPIRQELTITLSDETGIQDVGIAETPSAAVGIAEAARAGTDRMSVLLVEDNEDFRKLLAGQLSDDYDVQQAGNGKEALDLLERRLVDLVISDVMMPEMDGMALCRHIKENLRYSHIPVILLTAKTGFQAQLDGLKIGADEYVVKPHSIDYLKARIANLLENRRKIRNSYRSTPEATVGDIANSKADEDFLTRLVDIIHSHIDASDLDVDFLASHMNMSRATLYRKVKSISELTPNDFIRLIRLKKAAELLRKNEYRINEIAFIVGFSSSSYFSKCFSRQFGVLPKDFARNR